MRTDRNVRLGDGGRVLCRTRWDSDHRGPDALKAYLAGDTREFPIEAHLASATK